LFSRYGSSFQVEQQKPKQKLSCPVHQTKPSRDFIVGMARKENVLVSEDEPLLSRGLSEEACGSQASQASLAKLQLPISVYYIIGNEFCER
jgi:hypothetical protein